MTNSISIPEKIKFSVIKHDVPVGKHFHFDEHGEVQSDTNGRLESALSIPHEINHIHELEPLLHDATGYEHIVSGISGHETPIGVYPGAFIEGSIARDNKHFHAPQGSGILLIDSDDITGSVRHELINVCPAIAHTACIETTSSSSNIYIQNKWISNYKGSHTFFAIKQAKDKKRTLKVLHKRLIINGYARNRVSGVGGFLERSSVDLMLASESQPIYLKPNLDDGIFQDKKTVKYDGDALFDTKRYVIDLTEEEEAVYDFLIQASKAELKEECDRKREKWISSQPYRESAIKALDTTELDGDFIIHTSFYGDVSVHDILMEPNRFHRMTCRDPFDDEKGSKTKAMIFTDQTRSMINSHAHGGSVYRLLDATMVGFGESRVPIEEMYPGATLMPPNRVSPAPVGDGGLALLEQPVQTVQLPNIEFSPDAHCGCAEDIAQPTDYKCPRAIYGLDQPVPTTNWIANLTSSSGKPRSTEQHITQAIAWYGIGIGYDEIGKKPVMIGQGMIGDGDMRDNANHATLVNICKMNQLEVTSMEVYINKMMAKNICNPVKNWVGSRPWDGNDRIRPLFTTLNAVENKMNYILFVKWMMGSYRLATGQIDSFEHVLVLQAEEGGEGKTRWFNKLTPKELNNSMSLRLDDKDQIKEAISYWIVELGELDSTFKKSDIKHLMGFLSKRKDTLRLPYAKCANEYSRKTSYAGTVNSKNFLIDDSGDRRFWIIETGHIDYNHDIDMQQFWAQIATLKENEWLTREQNASIIELNKDYKMEDPLIDMLEVYFGRAVIQPGTHFQTATEILLNAGIRNPNRSHVNSGGRWLRSRGYKQAQKRINGEKVPVRGYNIPYFHEQIMGFGNS